MFVKWVVNVVMRFKNKTCMLFVPFGFESRARSRDVPLLLFKHVLTMPKNKTQSQRHRRRPTNGKQNIRAPLSTLERVSPDCLRVVCAHLSLSDISQLTLASRAVNRVASLNIRGPPSRLLLSLRTHLHEPLTCLSAERWQELLARMRSLQHVRLHLASDRPPASLSHLVGALAAVASSVVGARIAVVVFLRVQLSAPGPAFRKLH